jgi:hypothetical protein
VNRNSACSRNPESDAFSSDFDCCFLREGDFDVC